jgi:hypothetical protein
MKWFPLPADPREEFGAMNDQDAEIEWLKAEVTCAVLLERLPPVWLSAAARIRA